MFSQSAEYYDAIYATFDKNYRQEAATVHRFIQEHKQSAGKQLLDAACGTGSHAGYLNRYYRVEGLDLDPKMLAVARGKHPEIRFHRGDLADFELGHGFDAIVCLFSSIGYVRTVARMRRAVRNMTRHLLPGGVLLVEPWFTPRQWRRGHVSTTEVKRPDLMIVRMSRSGQKRRISLVEFHYLIGRPGRIEHFAELHELGLFTHREYLDAFKAAGLTVTHDPQGLIGRGLYIGVKR